MGTNRRYADSIDARMNERVLERITRDGAVLVWRGGRALLGRRERQHHKADCDHQQSNGCESVAIHG